MSRNRKQSNKTHPTANQKPTEAEGIKENLQAAQASVKDKVDELKKETANKPPQNTTPSQSNNKAADKVVDNKKTPEVAKSEVPKKTNVSNETTPRQADAEKKAANQPSNIQKAGNKPSKLSTEPKKTEATSNNNNPPKKMTPKQQPLKNKQQINYAPAEKKSGGGRLLAGLALLLGVAGTGLGAYSFNELRLLKSGMNQGIDEKLSSLDGKITALEKADPAAAIKTEVSKEISALSSQQQTFKAAEERFNQRIAEIEQMQKGLNQSVKNEIDTALQTKLAAVDSLLAKVKDIELGQQGLSKNLSETSAATRAISSEGMEKQEVGYLLRMAGYKLQSEADVIGATGLLKLAESKLLAANQGKTDAMIDAIREKIIQLSGVKAVDTDALLGQLKQVSRDITQLQPKVEKTVASSTEDKTEEGDTASNMFDKLTSVIASGVKYTPKDPSKIDISAETILIEKRLMQADVKTAELAVQSHNKVMLAESVKAISDSLQKFFTADDTAKSIEKTLTNIAQSELETVMPSLSALVKQFESSQQQ